MTSNRVAIGPWEKFTVVNHGVGVSLKSSQGTYVVAESNGQVKCRLLRSAHGRNS